MITDLYLKLFKKDHLIKRNITKTISWLFIGSIDTLLLTWLISSDFSLAAKIGLAEFITKMFLYYFHERVWQESNYGLPTVKQRAKITQKEVKPNLFKQIGNISRQQREVLNNHLSFTIWLTGLSGSGKSTLATEIETWYTRKKSEFIFLMVITLD